MEDPSRILGYSGTRLTRHLDIVEPLHEQMLVERNRRDDLCNPFAGVPVSVWIDEAVDRPAKRRIHCVLDGSADRAGVSCCSDDVARAHATALTHTDIDDR